MKVRVYPDGIMQYEGTADEIAVVFPRGGASATAEIQPKMGLSQFSPEIRAVERWIRTDQPKYLELEELYRRAGCRTRAIGRMMTRLVQEGLYNLEGQGTWSLLRLSHEKGDYHA